MIIFLILSMVAAGALAYLSCQWLRQWLVQREFMDRPNERSSHTNAVPRGGGLAVVMTTIVVCAISFSLDLVKFGDLARTTHSVMPAVVILVTLFTLMLLGFIDDARSIGVSLRLIVELLVATVVVGTIYLESASTGPLPWGLWVWLGVAVLAFVWMTNLFNFMDGIDLISAQQTIISTVTLAIWFWWVEADHLVLLVCILLAAMIGFSPFNLPPARLFLGDSGSLALGGGFAAMAVVGVLRYEIPFVAFVLLFGAYLADSGVTILRRLVGGENVLRPHRTHYYQRAVRAGVSHQGVSARLALVNVILAILATSIVACNAERLAPWRPDGWGYIEHQTWFGDVMWVTIGAGVVAVSVLLVARQWVLSVEQSE